MENSGSLTPKRALPKVVLAMHFLVLMAFSSLAVLNLLPLFLESLGGSPRQIGFVIGIFSFAAFLSRPLAGWLLGRVRPKRVCVAGLGLMLLATCLYVFVKDLGWEIFAIRICHGLAFSLFVLAAMLITILAVPEKTRTYAIGIVSTGFMLPLLLVPYLAEVIIQKYSFFYFFLVAAIFVAIPFISILFIKSPMPRMPNEPDPHRIGFLRLLTQKRMLVIFLLAFIFEVGLSSSLSFVPLLAYKGSSMRAGYFYMLLGLTAVCLRIFGGKKFLFWGNPQLVLPAFYFLAGGAVLLYFSQHNILLALSGLVWGLGTGILYPHLSALAVVGTSTREKGMTLSLFTASVDLGFAFGPIIFGWMSQAMGVRTSFLPLAAIVFLSSSLLILFRRSLFFYNAEKEEGQRRKMSLRGVSRDG
jgi:predicted MFS family arabinose efflux permease